MEWIERLNRAVWHIEDHLTEDVDFGQLAQIACCSTYHFQRMFAYMTGVPLSEYIRRRRMTRAAVDLQNGGKVIHIALKYGYDSPTAFNRAFQSIHGVAPSLAREPGVLLKSFPPISFTMVIKGAVEMEYRIEKKDAFRIVGVSAPLEREIEKNFESVPKLWGQATMDGTIARLVGMTNGATMGLLGVSICNDVEDWRYYIAVSTSLPVDGLEERTIPPATWAIFRGQGTGQSIQELEKRVVMEWLPSSGYEYGNAADIEVYLNADPQNMEYEVWIPVVKKA